jgi:hypothetical protein
LLCTLRLIGVVFGVRLSAGNSPRRATHFLLSRQKKVSKEKATPLRATLRFATGNLRCSLFAGSAQTRFAQTRAALIREKLRSSARTEGLESNAPWRVFVFLGPSLRSAGEQPTGDRRPATGDRRPATEYHCG